MSSTHNNTFLGLIRSKIDSGLRDEFSVDSMIDTANLQPTIVRVRNVIRNVLVEFFDNSTSRPSDLAINWLTHRLLVTLKLNDIPIANLILANEYRVTDLSYNDARLLSVLLSKTTLGEELQREAERKRKELS